MNFKLVLGFEIATMIQKSVKRCSKGEVLIMLRGVLLSRQFWHVTRTKNEDLWMSRRYLKYFFEVRIPHGHTKHS